MEVWTSIVIPYNNLALLDEIKYMYTIKEEFTGHLLKRSMGKETELNSAEMKGRRIFKHWSELMEKY